MLLVIAMSPSLTLIRNNDQRTKKRTAFLLLKVPSPHLCLLNNAEPSALTSLPLVRFPLE